MESNIGSGATGLDGHNVEVSDIVDDERVVDVPRALAGSGEDGRPDPVLQTLINANWKITTTSECNVYAFSPRGAFAAWVPEVDLSIGAGDQIIWQVGVLAPLDHCDLGGGHLDRYRPRSDNGRIVHTPLWAAYLTDRTPSEVVTQLVTWLDTACNWVSIPTRIRDL